MNSTSAQISAFAVLIATVVGVAVLTNRQEIDTSVNTRETTLLPNIYDGANQDDIEGFSIRYPLGWDVSDIDTLAVQLSRPVNANDRDGARYNLIMTFFEDPVVDNPLAFLGEGATVLELEGVPFPAGELKNEDAAGNINVVQAVRLSETVILAINNDPETPIASGDWPAIRDQLANMFASIELSDDFGLVVDELALAPDVFTFPIPEGWVKVNDNKVIVALQTPIDPAAPQAAVLQFGVLTDEQITGILAERVAALIPNTDVSQITDPVELMNLFGTYEGDSELGILITTPLSDVTYFGLEGVEYGLETSGGISNWAVLTADDGRHILVNKFVIDKTQTDALMSQMNDILNTVEYTSPSDELLEAESAR